MNEESIIKFYSTNHNSEKINVKNAILNGQAPDKGLYMPEQIPNVTQEELEKFKEYKYWEIAYSILKKYTNNIIADEKLKELCIDAYDYPVPIENVYDNIFVMRLDQGPTCSFKDFAARMMARLMGRFLEQEHGELIILTATSGDTGSAVASAFHNVPGIKIIVLFPIREVSERQRKQMTTLGGNVQIIGVDGKFDDCQAIVKKAFTDSDLKNLWLSSANSINIARLLPQMVYYFYAYSRTVKNNENIIFSVPSGNFGDMMGCILAKKMGLPVEKLIISTNENREVPDFLKTAVYNKIEPSIKCISNAMNVGHPSNFARLIDAYNGQMDELGNLIKSPDIDKMRNDLWGISITDKETRDTIKQAYKKYNLLLEPHGAVGWAGLQAFLKSNDYNKNCPIVSVETAHPAKFPEEIIKLLGVNPEAPDMLSKLDGMNEEYDNLPNDYDAFKGYLKNNYF